MDPSVRDLSYPITEVMRNRFIVTQKQPPDRLHRAAVLDTRRPVTLDSCTTKRDLLRTGASVIADADRSLARADRSWLEGHHDRTVAANSDTRPTCVGLRIVAHVHSCNADAAEVQL